MDKTVYQIQLLDKKQASKAEPNSDFILHFHKNKQIRQVFFFISDNISV